MLEKTGEGMPFEVLPINAHSGQNQPDNFEEIFQILAQLAKYLKEKCWSEHYQQLSFKYFVK